MAHSFNITAPDRRQAVTYQVPPKPADPKPRMVRVCDPAIIEAVKVNDLRAPIGAIDKDGTCWCESLSLRQYLGEPVEFNV